jgi:Raf kinase inhibitor-like YbhB/YbcL family protein
MALAIKSRAFQHNGSIPVEHTCEGPDTSPPLEWSGAPSGTKSFALIVDDPDAPDPKAPKMTYVHWVLYDIPPNVTSLAQGTKKAPSGARDGVNPPIGRHRYFFKLYALDTLLGDKGQLTKAKLEDTMKGHVLEKAELIGTYQKTKK